MKYLRFSRFHFFAFILLFSALNLFSSECRSQGYRFEIGYSSKISSEPISGRLLLFFNEDTTQLPLYGSPSTDPKPIFAIDVHDWKPGTSIIIDSSATFWKHKLNELEGYYGISALLEMNTSSSNYLSPGNPVSEESIIHLTPDKGQVVKLELAFRIYPYPFPEIATVKEMKFHSELLTDFLKKPVDISGAIILPESYNSDPVRKYPIVFVMPGWGGNRFHIVMGEFNQERYGMNNGYGEDKIFVFLDQDCRFGYHVFANSVNNGPWGDAFIKELIPYMEKNYRVIQAPWARFATGQSSGGWAVAWLIANYPDSFGGGWAGSPDPIDFRYFENYGNIYDETNNFLFNQDGNVRNHARHNGKETVDAMTSLGREMVYGEGGQLQSYEAVFGRKGKDGLPEQLFNRQTGVINPTVAKHWRNYDITYLISQMDHKQRAKIARKLHLFVSFDDDYYLNLAVESFKKTMDEMNVNFNVRFSNNRGHSAWTDDIRFWMHQSMDSIYQQHQASGKQ